MNLRACPGHWRVSDRGGNPACGWRTPFRAVEIEHVDNRRLFAVAKHTRCRTEAVHSRPVTSERMGDMLLHSTSSPTPRETMRLTAFSDYALRVLMYAASQNDRLITIEETAAVYGISRAHLMKVVNQLTRAGFLKATRGRTGGLALGKSPKKIRLGDVVRVT